jgi:isopentenyl diphosphate isomerase/L-lactate dehydrogenase-like FMN-dependent dehydrogenase
LPRHLVDVSVRTQATMLFGRDYASPFGIAPTEIAALFRREADLMLAEAAALARVPLHHVWLGLRRDRTRRQVAPDNTWHQFYPVRDPAIT